jgi:hypothetical protein
MRETATNGANPEVDRYRLALESPVMSRNDSRTRHTASAGAFAVLVSFCLLTLGGCGDDPASSSTAGSGTVDLTVIRACELLTASEIEAATGIAPASGQDMSQADGRLPICSWPRSGGAQFDTFVNLLVAPGGYDSYDEFLERSLDSPLGELLSEEDAVQEVDGAGDFGVWMRELRMLQVYDGDLMVQVTAQAAAGRDELEAARALAVAALDRVR